MGSNAWAWKGAKKRNTASEKYTKGISGSTDETALEAHAGYPGREKNETASGPKKNENSVPKNGPVFWTKIRSNFGDHEDKKL